MSIRTLFLVLMGAICVLGGALLSWTIWHHFENAQRPDQPCSSIIQGANLIDQYQSPYQFNGVITWWPQANKLTLFGVKSDKDNAGIVFDRALQLQTLTAKKGVIQAKISDLKIFNDDKLPPDYVILGEKGKDLTLLFKPIDHNSWLMLINDNWIMMCENK